LRGRDDQNLATGSSLRQPENEGVLTARELIRTQKRMKQLREQERAAGLLTSLQMLDYLA
jgi:hypothetical protein